MRINVNAQKLISVFFGVLLTINAFAQDYNPVFMHSDGITRFLRKNLEANYNNNLDTLNESTICYAKFKVDSLGKIPEISFSTYTNPALIELFTKMIVATEGYWKPAQRNGKSINSRYFLLPIWYRIEGDKTKPFIDNTLEGFWYVFRYDSKVKSPIFEAYSDKQESLECVLLHPISFFPTYKK